MSDTANGYDFCYMAVYMTCVCYVVIRNYIYIYIYSKLVSDMICALSVAMFANASEFHI